MEQDEKFMREALAEARAAATLIHDYLQNK